MDGRLQRILVAVSRFQSFKHQGQEAYPCFLVYGKGLTEEANSRLTVMRETNDGFRIAEKDLEIRGPGEMTGERQSGFLHLRFASLTSDLDIVERARAEAERIIREDKGLLKAENAVLRNQMLEHRSLIQPRQI